MKGNLTMKFKPLNPKNECSEEMKLEIVDSSFLRKVDCMYEYDIVLQQVFLHIGRDGETIILPIEQINRVINKKGWKVNESL